MLVVKATMITEQEVLLDKQTFEQPVQRASQIEAVIEERDVLRS